MIFYLKFGKEQGFNEIAHFLTCYVKEAYNKYLQITGCPFDDNQNVSDLLVPCDFFTYSMRYLCGSKIGCTVSSYIMTLTLSLKVYSEIIHNVEK